MGRRDRNEIGSRLLVLLVHLLKWSYQPEGRTPSWKRTIREQRAQIALLLLHMPSLRDHPNAIFLGRYRRARIAAADETGLKLDVFPEMPPMSIDQALDRSYFPGDATDEH